MSAVLSSSVAQPAPISVPPDDGLRHDWTHAEVQALLDLPFNDLLFRAQTIHRQNFEPNTVQLSTLLSIKTGACPEDCAYCRSEEHTSELQSLMRISYAVFCLKKKKDTSPPTQ